MPDPRDSQALWPRYDELMRKGGDLTTAEKAELQQLRATLVTAGIIIKGDF